MGIKPPSKSGHPTLLQQLFADKEHINQDIFALCLAEWGGQLSVGGENSSYHQGEVQYLRMSSTSGYYNVYLSAITVGSSTANGLGSVMIDSGTTYSYFASRPYQALRKGIEDYCSQNKGCGASKYGSSCYALGNSDLSRFPEMKMLFENVETRWSPRAYLYWKGRDRWCYSFQDDGPGANTVLGTSWMMHQDVIFDVPGNKVGVAPARCPEYRERPNEGTALPFEPNEPRPGLRSSDMPRRKPSKAQKFNVGLLWAGLSGGVCLATGIIGIVAAVCPRLTSDQIQQGQSKNLAGSGSAVTVGMSAQSHEEDGLLVPEEEEAAQGPKSPNFLKVA